MTQQPTEPELTDDQRDYEALFGRQDEWHQPPAEPQPDLDDDDAVYRALFGE
jgi:hypothetical protein